MSSEKDLPLYTVHPAEEWLVRAARGDQELLELYERIETQRDRMARKGNTEVGINDWTKIAVLQTRIHDRQQTLGIDTLEGPNPAE